MNEQTRCLHGLASSGRDIPSIIENQGNVANQALQQTVFGGIHINQPALPTTIPPKPTSTVPFFFRRDTDFVNRGDLLEQIDKTCSTPAGRVALVGLGGIGKSQLAIEYSYRFRERSPETWVFWVHASTTARFEEGYRAIADTVEIPGRKEPTADILQLVKNWLCNERHGKWLMILDNADDASIFFNIRDERADTRPLLSAYLPQSHHGSILVTTRNEDAAFRLTGGDRDIIRVKPMEESTALELLQKKVGGEVDKGAAKELVVALAFIPLAIAQAAAYLRQRGPRCSIQQYIRRFNSSDRSKASLLDYDAGDLRRDQSASNSVIITWQMSFDHIRRTRPSAADLLSLMSFFDPQQIPAFLLQQGSGAQTNNKGSSAGNDDGTTISSSHNIDDHFEDDIAVLKNFSLITANQKKDAFEMHGLIQLSTRKWLEAECQLEKWKQIYIAQLCQAFPPGEFENWKTCETLFAHAEAAVEQQPMQQKYLEKWALLLYNAGWYALRKGIYLKAEKMLQNSVEAREDLLGQKHPETLAGLHLLGNILEAQGSYLEAEKMYQRALDGRKRVLGKKHPDTLISMSDLAITYRYQGRLNEGEKMLQKVLNEAIRMLGKEHHHTLIYMSNLASIYLHQGRQNEAEELYIQAIEIKRRVLGEEHPYTLTSLNSLASIYHNQGRLNEAEELYLQVIGIKGRVLGEEHPDTLLSLSTLASTYHSQGRWKKAEELFIQVIGIRRRISGEEHPDTLISMHNLALTYDSQARYDEAEKMMEKCVRLSEQKLGSNHPNTIRSKACLDSWQGKNLGIRSSEEFPVDVNDRDTLLRAQWFARKPRAGKRANLLQKWTKLWEGR